MKMFGIIKTGAKTTIIATYPLQAIITNNESRFSIHTKILQVPHLRTL